MHDAAVRASAAGPRFHSLAHGPNQTDSMALVLSGVRKGRPPARLSRRNRGALCSPAQQFQTPPAPPRTMHVLGEYKNPRKVNYWTLVGGEGTTAIWPSQGSQTRVKIEGRLGCLSGLSGLFGLSCCRIGEATGRVKGPGDQKGKRARGPPTAQAQQGSSDYLHLSLKERPRLPFTARIGRAHSYRARSASKKGTWPLLPFPSKLARYLYRDGG
jgi:hypothetical protein